MFAHVLVPIDAAELQLPSLEAAGEIARQHGASVTLLHVIETLEGADDDAETRSFYRRLEEKAGDDLARAREDLINTGVEAETLVVYGKRSTRILEVADQRGADLIVMAARSLADDEKWASLSHRVAFASKLSVLLVR